MTPNLATMESYLLSMFHPPTSPHAFISLPATVKHIGRALLHQAKCSFVQQPLLTVASQRVFWSLEGGAECRSFPPLSLLGAPCHSLFTYPCRTDRLGLDLSSCSHPPSGISVPSTSYGIWYQPYPVFLTG